MFRLWAREWKRGHVIRETIVEDPSEDTRTHKIFHARTEVCRRFDLAEPIWLDSIVRDFQRDAKCRFTQDAFMEPIDFDYLEIRILEEDDQW